MVNIKDYKTDFASLPPREAWIEISKRALMKSLLPGRFPRGKRGLKSMKKWVAAQTDRSLPPREAWIEIIFADTGVKVANVASPAGSVD